MFYQYKLGSLYSRDGATVYMQMEPEKTFTEQQVPRGRVNGLLHQGKEYGCTIHNKYMLPLCLTLEFLQPTSQ